MTLDDPDRFPFLRHSPHPGWLGAILFGITMPVHFFVPEDVSIGIAAITLALIGGAYIGFGSSDGRPSVFWTEVIVAGFFGMAALIGLFVHWSALPIGLAAHAVWDGAHHYTRHFAKTPKWYVPFCAVFDLLAAAFLTLLYVL